MRRLRSLIWHLPVESAMARIVAASLADPPSVPASAEQKKVDYAALRAMGGEVITIPKKTG